MKDYLIRSYTAVAVIAWIGVIATPRLYAQGGGKGGQSSPSSSPAASASPSTYVVYNYKYAKVNPDGGSFPIDRPFTFEIDSIPPEKIFKVYVYAVKTEKGQRKLAFINPISQRPEPSFELRGKDTASISGGIILRMPAIRPEVKFDIAIVKAFSAQNMAAAMKLNKMLYGWVHSGELNVVGTQLNFRDLQTANQASDAFSEFLKAVNGYDKYSGNNVNYLKAKDQFGNYILQNNEPILVSDIQGYYTWFYEQVESAYGYILKTDSIPDTPPQHAPATKYVSVGFFTQAEISSICNVLQKANNKFARLFLLQKISDQKIFPKILTGMSGIDVAPTAAAVDKYDFPTRIKNIGRAANFLDSVRNALYLVKGRDTAVAKRIVKTSRLITDLDSNRALITHWNKYITVQLTNRGTEDIWVSGQSTASPDMATISSRQLGVNFGLTNIFARDNSGKLNYIPKFFLGVDYRLGPSDVTADWSEVKPLECDDERARALEARETFLMRVSFTVGLTFGGMSNKDFDNSFSSFSVTAGPSIRVFKFLKLSAGAALIHRYDNNPLLSAEERPYVCPYASISFDYDLLNAVSSVISNFTK